MTTREGPSGASKDAPRPTTEEERLAAALRENLRRRKAQERARSRASDAKEPGDPEAPGS